MKKDIYLLLAFLIFIGGCTKEKSKSRQLTLINGTLNKMTIKVTNLSNPTAANILEAQNVPSAWTSKIEFNEGDSLAINAVWSADEDADVLVNWNASTSREAVLDTVIRTPVDINVLSLVPPPNEWWGLILTNTVLNYLNNGIILEYKIGLFSSAFPLFPYRLPGGKPNVVGAVSWFKVEDTQDWKDLHASYFYWNGSSYVIKRFKIWDNPPLTDGTYLKDRTNYYSVTVTD